MATTESYDVILVGGGPSTRILNKYLHKLQPGIRTVVIRDEERIVNHCGTPYIVEGVIPWEKGLIKEELVTRFDTEIVVDPLVGGDPQAHEIELASGRRLRYGKLVLATGTDQVLPPIPGVELDGVLKVRRTEDVQRTLATLGEVRHVTVLGGGYIGLEFAVALRKLGKEVLLVELLDHVMGGRVDAAMATAVEDELRGMGIEVVTGTAAERLEGDDGRVGRVVLAGGRVVETDAVLSAVGVRPLIDYAPGLGLETRREGIVVDEYFRTSQPDIFAMGDCAISRCAVTGRIIPGKLGSNAGQMARTLALNLAGLVRRPYQGVVNAAVTRVGELAYGGVGLSEVDAQRIGMEVLVSRNTSTDRYDNMPGVGPVEVKIVFRAEDRTVVGGELLGRFNPAGFVEALAQLIERRATLADIVTMPYSSHPELTPKTSKPFWVWATEPLLLRLGAQAVSPQKEEAR